MRITLIATPTGHVPTLRDKGRTVWEGPEQPTAEQARQAAIDWLNSDETDSQAAHG
jgi:hypothetical protein